MLLTRRPISDPSLSSRINFLPINISRAAAVIRNDHVIDNFIAGVEHDFQIPLQTATLRQVSTKLQTQFREKLGNSDISMLPSYSDAFPTGAEKGDFLAADLGGSVFRLAWIRLAGSCNESSNSDSTSMHAHSMSTNNAGTVVRRWDFPINEAVRSLVGKKFFQWMAKDIATALNEVRETVPSNDNAGPLSMGLSWSFPLDHKSPRDARLLQMGKAFRATDGLIGCSLGSLIENACRKQGIELDVSAIVNDGAAGLLSQIYANQSTTMAVILGTGLNAAIDLPSTAVRNGRTSPQSLPTSPTRKNATNTVINTELSMFGGSAYPLTKWDHLLSLKHPNPTYQPLEHLTSGRYLGELVRLILVKAIQDRAIGLFAGEFPTCFGPYELETSTLAAIESDTSPSLSSAIHHLESTHPLPSGAKYTARDLATIRRIAISVSSRAAAYLATAVYALWKLERSFDLDRRESVGSSRSSLESQRKQQSSSSSSSVGCLGSVLVKYPRFRARVQKWLDLLIADDDDEVGASITLVATDEGEGALMGAAVAVAVATSDSESESCSEDEK